MTEFSKQADIRDIAISVFNPYTLKMRMRCDLKPMNVVLRMNRHDRDAYYKSLYRDVGLIVTGDKRPPVPLERAHLVLKRHANRMYDYDGLVAAFKPVVDGLQHAGILKHDGWYVTGPWNVGQAISSVGNESIYIEVQEAF
jgi:hypothetical protein